MDVRDLLANSSDGACLLDRQGRITFWNQEAEGILGYRAEEVAGLHYSQVFQATQLDGTPICGPQCTILCCFNIGRAAPNHVLLARARDGSRIALSHSTAAYSATDSDGLGGVIFFRPALPNNAIAPTLPPLWEFHCLGRFEIRKNGSLIPLRTFPRRQAVTLLKVLLTHRGRPLHRDMLMELLWPEIGVTEGLQRLKVLVHTVREVLEPERQGTKGAGLLVTNGESYLLQRGPSLWVDVDAYERHYSLGKAAARSGEIMKALDEFRQAANLYQGEYLPENRYEDWCAEERERLHEVQQNLLVQTAEAACLAGELEEAVGYYQRALANDPCREANYRAIMKALWRLDRPDEALRYYQRCVAVLQEELEVSPVPETTRLYKAILQTPAPTF